jgi:high affinity Mn2+ porin
MTSEQSKNISPSVQLNIRSVVRATPVAALLLFASTGGRFAAAQTSADRGGQSPPQAQAALFPEAAQYLARIEEQGWFLHGSATFILQAYPRFRAPYRGPNSLSNGVTQENTFSADLPIGRRLWEGAEIVAVPQVSRGFGLTNTRGIAAFPNNEAFRLGSVEPIGYFTRLFLRQTIPLSADTVPVEEDDPLRFRAPVARERITLTTGKVSMFDFFDDNRYAHDPRTHFQNWAFVGSAAYDFAADARGYTNGAAAEWENGAWAVRTGAFQVARDLNSLALDPRPLRGWQVAAQIDRFYELGGRPGAVRLLGGLSRTNGATFGDLLRGGLDYTRPGVRRYTTKQMLALNLEQEIAEELGVFARLSWNDGRSLNWMFTEMDWAVSAGMAMQGGRWGRPADTVGLAVNVGGISGARKRFLEAGGVGFIVGDGRLNYAPEYAMEAYYDVRVAPGLNAALDYQLIVNPAYNADRGPVSIFGFRLRAAF